MLNVAIAIDVPGEAAGIAAIISSSCEAAVGASRCPIAKDLKASSVVAWYAIVRSEDAEGSRLRIELRDRSAIGVVVETRDLTFSENDRRESRWASAGVVIAALVAARDSPDAASTSTHPTEPRFATPVRRRAPWGFDLAIIVGPGLDRGAYRVGGLVRGFVGLPRSPSVIGEFSLHYTERPGELDLSWLSASGGVGARIGNNRSVSAELIGELVFERMFIAGRNVATGHEASSGQNRFGGRLGANVALRVWGGLGLVLGAEVSALRPSVDITFLDAKVGREPLVGVGLAAGIRIVD